MSLIDSLDPAVASAAPAATSAVAAAPRAGLFGISAAMVTPFLPNGQVDMLRAGEHAAALIAGGANGVTLFGTTGEGAALGRADRGALLAAVLGNGVPVEKVTVCLCATSLEEAEYQARVALSQGVKRLLATPPFYFKGVSDDALYDWYAALLGKLSDHQPEFILYHIPQVTGVGLSEALIRRLKDTFGAAIFGVKDSSGDWANAEALLKYKDLAILIGDERLLARAAPLGGAGAISGMANLFPARLGALIRTGVADPEMSALVDAVVTAPVTPLVKALVGVARNDPAWARVRPPLTTSDRAVVARVAALMTPMADAAPAR